MALDRRGGSELFYLDEGGRRRDAELHQEILSQGDDGPGLEVSTKIREGMLAKARRYLPAEPVNKPKEPAKDAWNPFQPREPAGTSEGGQFASITGGGISGGATGGPAKKLFEPSTDKAHHEKRVSDTLLKPALRNDNYRYVVGKLVEEAKGHGAGAGIITELRTKIGESFYQQGLLKKEKGQADLAQNMIAKGKSYGYVPTAEDIVKEQAPAPAATVVEPAAKVAPVVAAAPPSSATIPVATPAWTKIGPQKGSVAGGMYGDPQGNTWYVKTPKTEAHVNADLLSNALYKMAGVSVSNQVKTVLEGKSAVASKFIPGMETLGNLPSSSQGYARQALREDFAVDAWLGNRDVIGEGFDNVIASAAGTAIVRLDQGGTLMYRAQGETKPFGVAVDEITSMRSPTINPQTASVFAIMTPAEVSASIDKVLAIPSSHIKNAVAAHGMPSSLADTLIARRDWLQEYQKTLDVPGSSPTPKAAAQPKPTAAELEKAKKVGPFYPAPTSEMGQVAVKHFNEKWATKTPEPHELEEKVADYKNAKAAIEAIQQEEMSAAEKAAAETKKQQAAATKAAKAAAEAKEQAESAKHQAAIAKIAADIGLNAADAEQVDALIHLAGGDPAKIVQQFKSFYQSGTGKHGLPVTPFEATMIQMYVGPHAYENNAKLRSGYWDVKTHVFAKGIQTALVKLPTYNAPVKRGFSTTLADQGNYVPGKIVLWHAFSSCGKSGSFSGNMQCTIQPLPGSNSRARDLGSFNPSETGGEVLFMANSSFKVTKVTGSPGGTMHVWMDEVETLA